MRGDTDPGVRGQVFQDLFRFSYNPAELFGSVAETDLPRPQRAFVAAAIPIMNGQKGQADSGLFRRRRNAFGHLGDIVVSMSVRPMVQVMKLGIIGVTGFQHLHLREGGDRFDMIRGQSVEKSEH